jgi:hypothetical protein
MGMFDSIYVKNLKCPYCGKVMEECELQTKDLHNVLDNYQFPDIIKEHWGPSWEITQKTPYKAPSKISVATDCSHCKEFFYGTVFIKQKVIYKYQFTKRKSKEVVSERECWYEGIKETLTSLNQNKQDNRELKLILEALIFSVYNGDSLTPENMKLLDETIKLKVLEHHQDKIGRPEVDSFPSGIGPASRYHSLIHKGPQKDSGSDPDDIS